MKRSYYIFSKGNLLQKDNTLRFINESGEQKDIPIETIRDMYIMTDMTLTTKMLTLLSKNGAPVHFFDYYQNYRGSYYPKETLLAGNVLVKQVNFYQDKEKRLELAKSFIDAASSNIYRNLRYYNNRGKDVKAQMDTIEALKPEILNAANIQMLMGVEGNIRKIYYSAWPIIIDQDIEFEKRVKHPPDNLINSLISYVNSLIYTKTLTEIYNTQLNPTISYLHEPGVRRFSLCLDLSEIFKPLLCDRLIFSLLNKKQITEHSFAKNLNYLHLTKDAAQLIASELENRLSTTIQHRQLKKQVSYQHLIRLEAYKLEKHILGEKKYSGFEIWW